MSTTTKSETRWSKEFPTVSGIYWARWPSSVSVNTFMVEVIGKRFYMTGRSLICPNSETPYPDEWFGPITPSDFEQLVRLREESLKGICVYCGEIQQYESLEQKASEEGNTLRIEHIKQCANRPELKLIDAMVQLHEAATNALTYLEETGESCRTSDLITTLRNALGTKEGEANE